MLDFSGLAVVLGFWILQTLLLGILYLVSFIFIIKLKKSGKLGPLSQFHSISIFLIWTCVFLILSLLLIDKIENLTKFLYVMFF